MSSSKFQNRFPTVKLNSEYMKIFSSLPPGEFDQLMDELDELLKEVRFHAMIMEKIIFKTVSSLLQCTHRARNPERIWSAFFKDKMSAVIADQDYNGVWKSTLLSWSNLLAEYEVHKGNMISINPQSISQTSFFYHGIQRMELINSIIRFPKDLMVRMMHPDAVMGSDEVKYNSMPNLEDVEGEYDDVPDLEDVEGEYDDMPDLEDVEGEYDDMPDLMDEQGNIVIEDEHSNLVFKKWENLVIGNHVFDFKGEIVD
jgi:hypothetical protein